MALLSKQSPLQKMEMLFCTTQSASLAKNTDSLPWQNYRYVAYTRVRSMCTTPSGHNYLIRSLQDSQKSYRRSSVVRLWVESILLAFRLETTRLRHLVSWCSGSIGKSTLRSKRTDSGHLRLSLRIGI